MKNNNNKIIAVVVLLLLLVLGAFVLKTQLVTTQSQLESNISTAVKEQDGKLFLDQFDEDSQKLKFAKAGSQSVVDQWHDHSNLPLEEIGKKVVNGQTVTGTQVHYKFYAESKTVLGVFKSYYLVAKPTSVILETGYDTDDLKFTLLNSGYHRQFTEADFKSGLFPGKYAFTMKGYVNDMSVDDSYYVSVSGSEDTYHMFM